MPEDVPLNVGWQSDLSELQGVEVQQHGPIGSGGGTKEDVQEGSSCGGYLVASRSPSPEDEVTITGRTPGRPALQNIPIPDTVSPKVRALIKLVTDLVEGRTSPLVVWMKLDPPTMLKPAPFDFKDIEMRMAGIDNGPQDCPVCNHFRDMYGKKR